MSTPQEYTSNIRDGHRRGIYELFFKDVSSLKREDIFETDIFEMGGFKWMIRMARCFFDSLPPEKLEVSLHSYNGEPVRADCTITFVCQNAPEGAHSKSGAWVAGPFRLLDFHNIDYNSVLNPAEGSSPMGELLVRIELQNIRIWEKEYRQCTLGDDMTAVNFEAINADSVRSRLKEGKAFGLLCTKQIRSSLSANNVRLRCRTEAYPNRRHWLCERCMKGQLRIQGCLDMAGPQECIVDVCKRGIGPHKWVTCFKEFKKDDEKFQPVDQDTILVFCKLYEPQWNDVQYLGHLLLQKTASCSELTAMAADKFKLPDRDIYQLYMEEESSSIREIAKNDSSLSEAGLFSGCVAIAVLKGKSGHLPKESVQQALRLLHKQGSEAGSDSSSDDGKEDNRPRSVNEIRDTATEEDKEGRASSSPHDTSDPMQRLIDLTAGILFSKRFVIEAERVQGKPLIRFAIDRGSNDEMVVLKFYSSRTAFENSKRLHAFLSSDFVCKLLHVIDGEDGYPPCLVFERGDETLDKWILRVNPDPILKKSVLFQILNCIHYLHCKNIVHCDIKPANLVFFSSKHVWKLLDTDTSMEVGRSCEIHYTPMYASPEVIQAVEGGQTAMIAETSMDMFSFGILAFEVLTGTRFYGLTATRETVKECLCGQKWLHSLESVEERQARRWLSGLLYAASRGRWPAGRALNHAVFQTAEDSTMKATMGRRAQQAYCNIEQLIRHGDAAIEGLEGHMQEVKRDVSNIKRTVAATYDEMCKANLMANIEIERLNCQTSEDIKVEDRDCHPALTMADDFIKDQPIFLLKRGNAHLVRISLAHKHQSDASRFKIKYVKVKPSGGNEQEVNITEGRQSSEVVGLFDTESFDSSKLSHGCAQFGSVEERYVEVAVTIGVAAMATMSRSELGNHYEMNGTIWCLPVSEHSPLTNFREFMLFASDNWKRAPQWMRDAAKGTVILTSVALKTAVHAQAAAPHQPMFWWNLMNTIANCFTLPCFRLRNA